MSVKAIVLLPTYNEADNLSRIVEEILAAAAVDIMILDDNSPDGTGKIADALAEKHQGVQVVHRLKKAGLGPAYIDGFKRALQQSYSHIIEMDADFSHPPACLKEMLKQAEHYDLVLGSRWRKNGGTKNWPWYRIMISRFGSLYTQLMLQIPISDLTGGFKCFHRNVLESFDLDQIKSTGYVFQIEMTYWAFRKGFKIYEMPFVFVERQEGVSKMNRSIVWEAFFKVPCLPFEKIP